MNTDLEPVLVGQLVQAVEHLDSALNRTRSDNRTTQELAEVRNRLQRITDRVLNK